ncbi:peptidoglycan bridge formation glycyltransferase FemA/FemB family protein [uncultured Aquimarina sp.]|uniref:peptidoglycan bridge formation glycyltransferase FemA/FemB family protein n=1 Tax=uncultured Aquimarina sp. TaxID=575652 RepID=UPI00262F2311|nr:peptidoglycan bridge formation glycyltransferase FemA/FemB family protein [uncultured Aquimarina sp.]
MLKISEITSKNDWDHFLIGIKHYDFYHTFDYHQIAKNENDLAVLLTYKKGDLVIGFPIVIRNIPETTYYDATSVYGYCGPIVNKNIEDFNNEEFIENLNEYFKNKNIVSVFSRLNPFIENQNLILNSYGEIVLQGKLVNIDITASADVQHHNFQNRLRTHINKSRRNCIVKKATTKEEILEFIDIYYENMKRVDAASFYFFSTDYFFSLIASKSFETEVLLAFDKETNKSIGGSIFIKTNKIIQYHLSGTKNEYLHLMPSKLLIDEMRIQGTEQKYEVFNLGGGLGGSNEDSLFRFKSSFSKCFKDFEIWKLVINQSVYNELVKKQGLINMINDINFFPLYRYSEHS